MTMAEPRASLSTLLASESLSSLILSNPIFLVTDLASLALVCKEFQLASTPFLYSRIVVQSQTAALKILNTLTHRPDYGPFVNVLHFSAYRNQPRYHYTVAREVSTRFTNVFPLLRNLEYLILADIWGFSAMIFQHSETILCKLKFCRLNGIVFSSKERIHEFGQFLAKQDELKLLRLQVDGLPENLYDPQMLQQDQTVDNDIFHLPVHSLPSLSIFDGSAFAATKVLQARAPLLKLRVHTALELDKVFTKEDDPASEWFAVLDVRVLCAALSRSGTGKTLKTFSVLGCPGDEDLLQMRNAKKNIGDPCAELIQTLAIYYPKLCHVGVLPLSCKDRSSVHEALMEMHSLQSIEFSVSPWASTSNGPMSHPNLGLQQNTFPSPGALKAISIEMKIYCPSLRYFVYHYRYPQPPSRYPRFDRIVWVWNDRRENENEKHTGWESEWVMGDSRSSWEDLWNMY